MVETRFQRSCRYRLAPELGGSGSVRHRVVNLPSGLTVAVTVLRKRPCKSILMPPPRVLPGISRSPSPDVLSASSVCGSTRAGWAGGGISFPVTGSTKIFRPALPVGWAFVIGVSVSGAAAGKLSIAAPLRTTAAGSFAGLDVLPRLAMPKPTKARRHRQATLRQRLCI